jgi:hypothetical protein
LCDQPVLALVHVQQPLDKAGLAGASLRSMNIQALYVWRFTDKGRQKNNDQVI